MAEMEDNGEEFEGGDGGAINDFEQAKADARAEFEGKSLRELAAAQKDYKERKEDLERQLKRINAFFDVLRFEKVPERMELDGVEKIKFEGIGRISLTPDIMLSVKGGEKEKLYDWLRERNFGSLIQPAVNASTLKSFVKGRIKKGEEYPSEYLNLTPITRASITKA